MDQLEKTIKKNKMTKEKKVINSKEQTQELLQIESTQLTSKPIVGISCCSNKLGIHNVQMVTDKYITAVESFSDIIPVLIPTSVNAALALLPRLDGILLTGSYSNIEPHHYGQSVIINSDEPRDKKRDQNNLALIQAALKLNLPVLGICRGFQEMNVALGGNFHQKLDLQPNLLNHSEDKTKSLSQQYALAHEIKLKEGGILANLMDNQLTQRVNSLHGQGINKLATDLSIEAVADDGIIEAFSRKNKESFFLGLQWHPEWQVNKNELYRHIFEAFGNACRLYKSAN